MTPSIMNAVILVSLMALMKKSKPDTTVIKYRHISPLFLGILVIKKPKL